MYGPKPIKLPNVNFQQFSEWSGKKTETSDTTQKECSPKSLESKKGFPCQRNDKILIMIINDKFCLHTFSDKFDVLIGSDIYVNAKLN